MLSITGNYEEELPKVLLFMRNMQRQRLKKLTSEVTKVFRKMLAEGHKMPKEVIEADVIVIEMLSWSCLHVPIMITVICDFHVNCNWKSDGLIQIEQITMAACHGVGYIYLGILPTLECCLNANLDVKPRPENAWVTLHLDLGHALGPLGSGPQ